jgi:hypothetical protein
MGNLSLRDRAILMSVIVLALYGLAAVLWFTKFQREWTKSAKGYAESVKTYQREKNLIARRGSLEESYLEEEEKIPVLAENELANATWMSRLGTMAKDCNVSVSKQNYGKEEQEGVLNKLEIDLEWTASLKSLVTFMHALETADHAMFDVRSIGISNSGKNTGYLKGKMTICCAYLREEEGKGNSK